MTAHAPEGIRADLARWMLGSAGLARARSGRAHVRRVANQDAHHLVFHLLRRGRLTMVHGNEAITAGLGDIVVADDSRPYAIDISEGNDCLILQLPIHVLGDAVALGDFHGRLLRSADPNVAFLDHMLQGLWSRRELFNGIHEDVGNILAEAARIICRDNPIKGNSPYDTESPVEYALRHLDDPELGTSMICEGTGLSPRAVQKAFLRHAATTPTAFIAERRLARAADILAADRYRSITDIAYEVGFSDSAFFSRCFRRHFSMTPRDWRAQRN